MADFASIRFQPSRPLLRELSADRLNTILTEIKRNKPKGERGITVRQDGTGTYIGLAAAISKGSSALNISQPWDLVTRTDPDGDPEDPTYLIAVRPGTLGGFLPTNWEEEFSANNEDLYYAKAIVQTDGVAITSVSVAIDTTPPENQDPQEWSVATTIEVLFGLFKGGLSKRVIGSGNLSLLPRLWLTAPANPPAAPGELPFVNYYRLA